VSLYSECRYAECRYAECRYAECLYGKCHYAEFRYADCRGAYFSLIIDRQTVEKDNIGAKVIFHIEHQSVQKFHINTQVRKGLSITALPLRACGIDFLFRAVVS
jgi:hypothetical protein